MELFIIGKIMYSSIYYLKKKSISKSFYREISILNELQETKYIIQIKNIILYNNLSGFIMQKHYPFIKNNIYNLDVYKKKKIIYQLLLSLYNCHSRFIIHRDI